MKNKKLMRALIIGAGIFALAGCGTPNDTDTNGEKQTKNSYMEDTVLSIFNSYLRPFIFVPFRRLFSNFSIISIITWCCGGDCASIVRKFCHASKTILLFFVLLIVNSMILSANMILRATADSKAAIGEKTKAKVVMGILKEENKITPDEVEWIIMSIPPAHIHIGQSLPL